MYKMHSSDVSQLSIGVQTNVSWIDKLVNNDGVDEDENEPDGVCPVCERSREDSRISNCEACQRNKSKHGN